MRIEAFPSSSTVTIRHAVGSDSPAIAALYRQLNTGDQTIDVLTEQIDEIARDSRTLLLVAEIDRSVVGTALLTICLDAMYCRQPFAVLENVVVTATRRSSGIGTALLNAVEAAAVRADCSKLMLLSSAMRTDAHRFFASRGFDSQRKIGFVKYRGSFER
jgi:N-acetylglutamate synthase-like GNAT family acetyltransferase